LLHNVKNHIIRNWLWISQDLSKDSSHLGCDVMSNSKQSLMIQTILLPPSSWSNKSTPLSLWRFGCADPTGGSSKIL